MSFWFLPKGTLISSTDGGSRIVISDPALPDFSSMTRSDEMKKALRAAEPDMPPESLQSKCQELWSFYHEILPEDVLIVASADKTQIHCAEVAGKYAFSESGDDGILRHGYPVSGVRTLSADALVKSGLPVHSSAWCLPVTGGGVTEILQKRLNIGQNRVRSLMLWLMGCLLLLKLFLIGLTYWKDATSHTSIF